MTSSIGGALSRMSNYAYGVAFLLTIALMVGLSVATFQKKFTPVVTVTLMAAQIGNQLQSDSDVKIRGLIVGEVRSITSTGSGARIELALQPGQVANIPVNVSARILPKTLFGERYVDLVIPPNPSVHTMADGDIIGQDHSTVAIELEKICFRCFARSNPRSWQRPSTRWPRPWTAGARNWATISCALTSTLPRSIQRCRPLRPTSAGWRTWRQPTPTPHPTSCGC